MDSRKVSSAIKNEVFSLLKTHGFTEFTSRSAWRFTDDRIELINFQSFNAYNAEVLGVTTYSFTVNLGVYLLCIPEQYPLKRKREKVVPEEYHCHFRGRLTRSFGQSEIERRDIWYIDPEGNYLARALEDLTEVIPSVAVPWFAFLRSDQAVLNTLLHEQEDMSRLWGFGNFDSPVRNLFTGFVALHAGERDLAREKLVAASHYEGYRRLTADPLGALLP